jgi:hypothetical protein
MPPEEGLSCVSHEKFTVSPHASATCPSRIRRRRTASSAACGCGSACLRTTFAYLGARVHPLPSVACGIIADGWPPGERVTRNGVEGRTPEAGRGASPCQPSMAERTAP